MAIDIVDFPSYKMVDLSIATLVITRGYPEWDDWSFCRFLLGEISGDGECQTGMKIYSVTVVLLFCE